MWMLSPRPRRKFAGSLPPTPYLDRDWHKSGMRTRQGGLLPTNHGEVERGDDTDPSGGLRPASLRQFVHLLYIIVQTQQLPSLQR